MRRVEDILRDRYGTSDKDVVLDGADVVSQKGYTLVPNYVLYKSDLTANAKLVYAMLLSYAWGAKDHARPGQDRIAKQCGLSKRTVIRAIKELSSAGFLTILRRGRGWTNIYVLHFKKRQRPAAIKK